MKNEKIPVFPVGTNKSPLVRKWEAAATVDPLTIAGWEQSYPNCMWGVPPGRSDLVVIDLDNHEGGADGRKSFEQYLEANNLPLTATYTVKTPSGGLHLYYRYAGGLRSRNGVLPGVDVKSNGGYVITEGSVSPRGKYTAVNPDTPIADLPEEWLPLLTGGRTQERGPESSTPDIVVGNVISPDTADKVAHARRIAADWPDVVVGERNHQLYQLAREWCRAGISRRKAYELYAEVGCMVIGLDPEAAEVTATIRSAYSNASDFGVESDEGRKAAAMYAFGSPVEPAEIQFSDGGPLDWSALAAMDVPPRKWFIKNWLSADEGYTVLFSGRGGIGKSSMIIDLALSLATGDPFLGLPILRRTKTLFVTCEDYPTEVARRIQHRKAFASVPDGMIAVWSRAGHDNTLCAFGPLSAAPLNTPFLAELKSRGREFFGADGGVLVLDTLADIFYGNENDRSQVSRFVKAVLNPLGSELNATIIVLAHPSKSGTSFSGSSAWEGAFRCRWELNPAGEDSSLVNLSLAKSNSVTAGETLRLANHEGQLRVVTEGVDCSSKEALESAVYDKICAMAETSTPCGTHHNSLLPIWEAGITDPVTGTPISRENLLEAVDVLLKDGRISRVRKKGGSYLFPGSGRDQKMSQDETFFHDKS